MTHSEMMSNVSSVLADLKSAIKTKTITREPWRNDNTIRVVEQHIEAGTVPAKGILRRLNALAKRRGLKPLPSPMTATAPLPTSNPPEYHALANIFPLLEDKDLDELASSIRENGQRDDIVIHDGQILDGRNRYRACIRAGAEPRYCELKPDVDPRRFVVDRNLHRRHLDDDQRRMVAARIANIPQGAHFANGQMKRSEAAELLFVDLAGLDRAKVVIMKGAEELQAAVDERKVTVRMAADLATLPRQEQREILAAADPKLIKEVARKIRTRDQAVSHKARQDLAERKTAKNPDLPAGRTFPLVRIDIPRKHRAYSDESGSEKAPDNHYPTMDFEATLAFPIDRFAATDAINLFWSTAASLLDDIDILAEWGFVALRPRDADGKLLRGHDGKALAPIGDGASYGSHQIWNKRRSGNQSGMGRWFRDQHETLIVARRGGVPAPLPGTQTESVLVADVGEHSEKPNDETFAGVDRCWPHLSKIYVFARGKAPLGWVFWGNEVASSGVQRAEECWG